MNKHNHKTFTRRQFLTRGAMAAGAVAVPYFIPASALGRAEPSPPANAS